MKLTNPYPPGGERVSADISPECFRYFFHGLFPGCRTGIRSSLIAQFFDKLHKHCLSLNLKPVFDPENESIVAGIISNLNFDDAIGLATRVKELEQQLERTTYNGPNAPSRPPRKSPSRRTNPRPPVDKVKP